MAEKLAKLNFDYLLLPAGDELWARKRILAYFLYYPRTLIYDYELEIISGNNTELENRIWELRMQGWHIFSSSTIRDEVEDANSVGDTETIKAWQDILGVNPLKLESNQYVLTNEKGNPLAALYWSNRIIQNNKKTKKIEKSKQPHQALKRLPRCGAPRKEEFK